MREGDHEHLAFEKFAKANGLDREMHPLHLLYLNSDTQKALDVFKAGYSANDEKTTPDENHPRFEGFVRAFWRRIEPHKTEFAKELPKELPIEFRAHMATALTYFRK